MFASPSRLDLGITVGPQRSSLIKTILSGPLPIFFEYASFYRIGDPPSVKFQQMRTAFGYHRDRVREICFEGTNADFYRFFEVTDCPFPVLESLVLDFKVASETRLPHTFLRGPKLSDLHLRRLEFRRALLASVSGFLSSATALTELTLQIDTVFGSSPETSLLACLQGMPYLHSLHLTILNSDLSGSLSQPSAPEDIVPLSSLTRFCYVGHPAFLSALLAGFSAPSLWGVDFSFLDSISSPIVHLPRFITEMKEQYHIAQVYIAYNIPSPNGITFSLLTHSESTSHCKPHFKLRGSGRFPVSIMQMGSALSTRLTTIEELRITPSEEFVQWLKLFQYFSSVRALYLDGTGYDYMARTLHQSDKEPNDPVILPALEEIQLRISLSFIHEIQRARQLEAFQPFVFKRQQAGRPVKVFFKQ